MREKALCEAANIFSKSLDENCEALMDDSQLTAVFGERYSKCTDQFEFSPGEKKLLTTLAYHVKSLVDGNGENAGLAQFNEKKKRKKRKLLHAQNVGDVEHVPAKDRGETSTPIQSSDRQLSTKLFERLIYCLKTYDIDPNDWTEQLVTVESNERHGSIKCIFCGENQKPASVFYQVGERSQYWVIANFERHLERKHKLIKSKPMKRKVLRLKQQFVKNPEDVTPADVDLLEASHSTPKPVFANATVESLNQMEESVQYVGVVPKNEPTETDDNDTWLYNQMSEQIQKMVAANLNNGDSEVSMEFYVSKNEPARFISVVQTSRDGDCMFSALAHQIWKNPIKSDEHKNKTKELRATIVEHILNPEHFHLYEEIIIDRLNKQTKIPTSECKLFIRIGLAKDQWEGLETLKAVSNEFKVNVAIVNEYGACNMVTGDNYQHTLLIAYRLNDSSVYDHYDSVSDIDSESIFASAKFILKK